MVVWKEANDAMKSAQWKQEQAINTLKEKDKEVTTVLNHVGTTELNDKNVLDGLEKTA